MNSGSFELRLRVLDWVKGAPILQVNGETQTVEVQNGFLVLQREWANGILLLTFPKALTVEALPDDPNTIAFLDGPLVLAGLVAEERTLFGDLADPTALLQPDQERHHGWWHTGTCRTKGQDLGFRFMPLCEVQEQDYCVYFPVQMSRK